VVTRSKSKPKRDEVTGEWRKLHSGRLLIYSSPHIIWVIKSTKIRWARYVARTGEWTGIYRVLLGTPEGDRPLRRPGVDWRIILGWIFRSRNGGAWTGLICLRRGTGGEHL
jgi:hypothetical protein